MSDFSLKAHDLMPSIQVQFTNSDSPVDITGCTVKFIMATAPGSVPKVSASAVIVDPVNGIARYDWISTDTDTPGNYQAEWEVTFPSGKKQTFPTATYHSIAILADLDNQ